MNLDLVVILYLIL